MLADNFLPIATAAQMVGRTRMALMKAIEKGRVSAQKDEHGRWYIDPAELQRVYKVVAVANENHEKPAADGSAAFIAQLQAENADLKQQRDQWKAQADNWMQQAQTLALVKPSQQGGGFWSRLFGK